MNHTDEKVAVAGGRFCVRAADGGETDLWSPGASVARLFKGYADSVAAFLGAPSGISDLIGDRCEIDLTVFEEFCAKALARYEELDHTVPRSLLVGFLATALALLDRAGGRMPSSATPEQQAAWAALRDQHAHAMPR